MSTRKRAFLHNPDLNGRQPPSDPCIFCRLPIKPGHDVFTNRAGGRGHQICADLFTASLIADLETLTAQPLPSP